MTPQRRPVVGKMKVSESNRAEFDLNQQLTAAAARHQVTSSECSAAAEE